ncbi:MAG: molybdopterin/thiamine biosynthesis adenylyltransferase/rhodanese-related sulfurtransferase [Myxococcota bacterium]|jgi:molybdopterin/thiamine biosynthesis adenylyltransferase/rhodanese-related sulfurtransferase
MALSFTDYLAEVKKGIREISVHELKQLRERSPEQTLVDVREPNETENGVVKGAHAVARGFLEMRIEGIQRDRSKPLILMCQGGTRSAMAALSVQALGYTDVVSVAGGMGAWSDAGYPIDQPKRLTKDELARYSRQTILPQVGEAGQLKLLNAKVLLVGAGGLGSPTALYLAAGGVGTLGIVDNDVVDTSNLQRQIIHREETAGTPKVESALSTLKALNAGVTVNTYNVRLTSENVMEIFKDYDIIVDGTDNFPTRYLINDACVFLGLPNVHGSIYHFDGQATIFHNGDGPCYRCLYPEPPPAEMAPSCAEAGVLGAICGVVGTIQAVETVKLILGMPDTLTGRLVSFDAQNMTFRELKVRRDPNCLVCSENPEITELIDYEEFCTVTF